ncbi:AarF/ABC1/UbiB kinase family protein [Microcoleus sp. FACHB-1515]|uniref:ABC1 kinase family protein n=1 Tax=Cyanophyceae TaxID=3028117 RepID=UPI0016894BC9|nr:AarF/ABC1/UbiB kinase family protein [Microcoleus sp. FACHB-1515]MBD2089785.1 AarF/ABC1/UbiB kinase family protein [Microcoleus sp. FACHB-1515]
MTLVTAPETESIDRSLPAEILADPLPDALKPANIGSSNTPALRYDPDAIEAFYRRRPFQVWGRLWAIAMPFALLALNLWWDRRTGQAIEKQPKRAEQVRKIVTKLGPAFIKIGQALSTRPDLVPPSYLEELTKLQDQLPPFPNEVAFRFIEEALGDRPENIYAELSPMPIAAASLGQVYKGKLKTGETVAVKVQRPGLAQLITLDIYILRRLSKWATHTFKQVRSDLVGITDEFGARIFEEMDYTQEGHNAERFAQLYGHLQDVYVPRIYWEYTARRVLTMEWITGVKLTQLDQIRSMGIDATHLIDVGVQCSLRQLLEHGFFHADPHPGNLLATPDGKLAYLDFGMMSEIKPYQRYGLIEAIVHLVNRDFEGLAQDYVKLEFLTPDTDLTPIVPAFAAVFNDALSASVAEINIKSMTDQLSALMYEYPFRVPAYYALIIRSLVTLEGIAINADPDFKVLSQAYPYVAKRLLTDQSPELRDSLRDLLFKDGSFRWNRLENLLRNARGSEEYDMSLVADQTLEFLFSDRGQFIREYLVNEIVKAIDVYSRLAIENATHTFWGWLGLQSPVNTPAVSPEERKNLDHLLRILDILRGTRGFDPVKFASILPRILAKPETQQMGQKIATGLAQRAIARFVREVILREPDRPVYQPMPSSAGRRSLPMGN